jgi:hypothetical protein
MRWVFVHGHRLSGAFEEEVTTEHAFAIGAVA